MQLSQGAIDIRVVDLARSWLMPSGNIRDVDQADPVDIFFEFFDQVPAGALLMIEVVQHLDVGAVDRAHDLKSVLHRRQEDRRIFDQVDRLDDNIDPVFGGHVGGSLQVVDSGRELRLWVHTFELFAGLDVDLRSFKRVGNMAVLLHPRHELLGLVRNGEAGLQTAQHIDHHAQ